MIRDRWLERAVGRLRLWLRWRADRPHPSQYRNQEWFRADFILWKERRPGGWSNHHR